MAIDESRKEAWAAMQAQRENIASTPGTPLSDGDGGGTSGGMEARIAKLEAQMEHVIVDLGKLSTLPADMATIKERTSHLPTKAEMKTDIDAAIERASTRTQRTIAVASGLVTLAVAGINFLPKLLGH